MKKSNNPHDGHRDRVKSRFIEQGLDSFDEHVIVELMLYYGISRKDTNEIAHELIDKFGSINGILDADIDELKNVKHVTEHVAIMFKLFQEISKIYNANRVKVESFDTIDNIGQYFINKFLYSDVEKFAVLALDSKKRLKSFEFISEGSISATEVSIPNLVRRVSSKQWNNIIICHNHPNGSAEASNADVEVTLKIIDAMNAVGVKVLDHIIVTDREYVSMISTPGYKRIFKEKN